MDDIYRAFEQARKEMLANWNRVLPSNELLFDRWEKARLLGFGEGSSIYDSSVVLGHVSVGKNVWVGPFTLLDGSGGLTIEDGCDISAGVQLYTHDTVRRAISEGKDSTEYASTTIGAHCHIGAGSIILKGVSIGHHSIVGAGCVVTKSFPDYSIIMGIPGRKVGRIEVGENIEYIYDSK